MGNQVSFLAFWRMGGKARLYPSTNFEFIVCGDLKDKEFNHREHLEHREKDLFCSWMMSSLELNHDCNRCPSLSLYIDGHGIKPLCPSYAKLLRNFCTST